MPRKAKRKAPDGAVQQVIATTGTIQMSLRMPKDLLERVDTHRKKLSKGYPGTIMSRADAIRNLLEMGLEVSA